MPSVLSRIRIRSKTINCLDISRLLYLGDRPIGRPPPAQETQHSKTLANVRASVILNTL